MLPARNVFRIVQLAALVLPSALGLWVAAFALGGERPTRPNIIVVVADDLGWNDVGYHGSEIETPNLDKLAAGGVRLEHFYVFPTCSPTRTALLTGRNPSRFGIGGPIGGRSTQAVPTETPSMADVLKQVGYQTALAGKWHLGLRPEVGPRQFGFDSTYGYLHGQIDPITHLYKNGDRTWHRNDEFHDEAGHATDLLAAEALRWIEMPRKESFFLYLAFSVPHVPLVEEAKWTARYEGKIKDPSRRLLAASITHMDDVLGQIVASLERSGQRERTLIIFTSDNGGQRDHLNTADYGGKFGTYPVLGNNEPLRGYKGELYEGGIRVPALASWPATLAPRKLEQPLTVLDWLPTVAHLVGASIPANARWEGEDIWGQLNGQPASGSRRFYWNTGRVAAVRDGAWKLIETFRPQHVELFDVAADPLEKTEQSAAKPEIVSRLRAEIAEERERDGGKVTP